MKSGNIDTTGIQWISSFSYFAMVRYGGLEDRPEGTAGRPGAGGSHFHTIPLQNSKTLILLPKTVRTVDSAERKSRELSFSNGMVWEWQPPWPVGCSSVAFSGHRRFRADPRMAQNGDRNGTKTGTKRVPKRVPKGDQNGAQTGSKTSPKGVRVVSESDSRGGRNNIKSLAFPCHFA